MVLLRRLACADEFVVNLACGCLWHSQLSYVMRSTTTKPINNRWDLHNRHFNDAQLLTGCCTDQDRLQVAELQLTSKPLEPMSI
jgi:hypothetical protein